MRQYRELLVDHGGWWVATCGYKWAWCIKRKWVGRGRGRKGCWRRERITAFKSRNGGGSKIEGEG